MGSLLRHKATVFAAMIGAMLIAQPSAAEENSVGKQTQQLIDGYYPPYPPTQPATGEQEELIKKGEYLSKMGDCIACHTNVEGGTPAFAGGLPIATPFGTFYSPNITPDKETGIGNWTEEDFHRALKEGRDPNGRNYFPVFPYVYFSKMSDEDVHALYTYFMSIPAVKQENKPLPFPFGLPGARFSLWGWNILFFYPEKEEFVYDKTKSAQWNRGRYIVDGLGHCSMCHTPLNVFGAPKNQYYLTGGFIDGYWAPNITKLGLQGASDQDIINVFAKGELINNAGPVAGPMADVNHNSLGYLTPDDHLAMVTYLKTVESEEYVGLPGSDESPTLHRGRQVYYSACVLCHQEGIMGAPLIGNSSGWAARLKRVGMDGLYQNAIKGYNSMPVKGACVTCSDNDIISAVDYIIDKSLSRSAWEDYKNGWKAKEIANGEATYQKYCSTCHEQGSNGAPKTGDKDAWKPILSRYNLDELIKFVKKGQNHPAEGGCKDCSTQEVLEAIKYMVNQSTTEGDYSLW